jgi:hypothetical protein
MDHPVTPDGRYFMVRGRLWRMSDPTLPEKERERLVGDLMRARSAKGRAMKEGDEEARERAKQEVDDAKRALGERGDPWWDDDAPDFNRKLARNTPYADWAAAQED